jgi:hypothetical protein
VDAISVENYSIIDEVIVCIYWVLVSSVKMRDSGSAFSDPQGLELKSFC